jgi:hypothetical protein
MVFMGLSEVDMFFLPAAVIIEDFAAEGQAPFLTDS